jgi:hypothetical protein
VCELRKNDKNLFPYPPAPPHPFSHRITKPPNAKYKF